VFGGGEIDLRRLPEHPHGAVSQYSQLPVKRVSAAEKTQDGTPAFRQFVHRNRQPYIAARIF
jgi:hypothetical protein